MRTHHKIVTLLIFVTCLSGCVGRAEGEIADQRNIRWHSLDNDIQFTFEYDQLEDTAYGIKFWAGRGTLKDGSDMIPILVYINMPLHHDMYIVPAEDAIDTINFPISGLDWEDRFPIHMDIDFVQGPLGIRVLNIHKLKATTDYNNTDIAYFDDFDQKLFWEQMSEDEQNPLNYFLRTWVNEAYGLSFLQNSPKLYLEQKLRGELSDGSPVLIAFGDDDFTMYSYDDSVEGDILLEGTYMTAGSSITLNIAINNLYPENPTEIVLV